MIKLVYSEDRYVNFNTDIARPPKNGFTPLVLSEDEHTKAIQLGAVFDKENNHFYLPRKNPNKSAFEKWIPRGYFMGNQININLIPESIKPANLSEYLPAQQWNTLSKQICASKGYRCEFCGGVGRDIPAVCLPIFEFNNEERIIKLEELVSVCSACFYCFRVDLASKRGYWHTSIHHLAHVNKITPNAAEAYASEAMRIWGYRSEYEWSLDLFLLSDYGMYEKLIKTDLVL